MKEVKKQLPRGIRNNNPLNIVRTKDQWLGLVTKNTDKRFCEFENMTYGYRAAAYIIKNYINRHKWNTIRKVIRHWAPPTENNTNAYLDAVCKFMGVEPDHELVFGNQVDILILMSAMTVVENGNDYNPQREYLTLWKPMYEGYLMAREGRLRDKLDYEYVYHLLERDQALLHEDYELNFDISTGYVQHFDNA